ncbi:MAG: hypothetical protein ACC645_16055 [Pirellulales bacterium]
MKKLNCLALVAALVMSTASVQAAEIKSGLQVGEHVGAFTVEKCAGNPEDGVPVGEKLCYRCMLGNRPVVAVFARNVDDNLASLVKQLDALVSKNEDKKMASFVNLLGDDEESLKSAAKSLVEKSRSQHVAVVVPKDYKTGPKNLKLNPKADVTVLIYRKGTVEANHAVPVGALNSQAIAAIVSDAKKILN